MSGEGDSRLRRRLLVLSVGSVAALPTMARPAGAQPRTGMTDNDPSDRMDHGRGSVRTEDILRNSDSDPQDPVGGSRRNGGAGRPLQNGGRPGASDSDPTDPPGRGRGGNGPRTGMTDSDPTDAPGHGRGGGRAPSGPSDRDPTDPPGQGRGTRT